MQNSNTLATTQPLPTPTEKTSHIRRIRTYDIEEHTQLLDNWNLLCDQLTPGRFEGDIIELRSGWMQIVRDRASQAMTKKGAACKGAIIFSIPISHSEHLYCSGHSTREPCMLVAHGENLPEVRTPQNFDVLSFAIEKQALEHALKKQGISYSDCDLPKYYRLTGVTVTSEIVSLTEIMFGNKKSKEISLMNDSIIRDLRDTIMLQLLEIVSPDESLPLTPTARKRVVDRAREYALSHIDEPLSILDLCNNIGASRRKLQYCFQEALGINPVAYLRALRLNGVHRELRESTNPHSVQEVATRWGFGNLGRFSCDYRLMFGERPSQTLYRDNHRRNSTGSPP